MNFKKIVSISLLMLSILLMLVSCTQVEPLTYEKFKSVAESQGFNVTLFQEKDLDYKEIKTYATAVNVDKQLTVEFLKFETSSDASALFEKTVENISDDSDYKLLEPEAITTRYIKISAEGDEMFYTLTQFDNTILMAYGPKDSLETISKVVSSMGYQ